MYLLTQTNSFETLADRWSLLPFYMISKLLQNQRCFIISSNYIGTVIKFSNNSENDLLSLLILQHENEMKQVKTKVKKGF
jgi:hypothetical protein